MKRDGREEGEEGIRGIKPMSWSKSRVPRFRVFHATSVMVIQEVHVGADCSSGRLLAVEDWPGGRKDRGSATAADAGAGRAVVVVGGGADQTHGSESGRCWESCWDRERMGPPEKAPGGRLPWRETDEQWEDWPRKEVQQGSGSGIFLCGSGQDKSSARSVCENHPSILESGLHHVVVRASGPTAPRARIGHGSFE